MGTFIYRRLTVADPCAGPGCPVPAMFIAFSDLGGPTFALCGTHRVCVSSVCTCHSRPHDEWCPHGQHVEWLVDSSVRIGEKPRIARPARFDGLGPGIADT